MDDALCFGLYCFSIELYVISIHNNLAISMSVSVLEVWQ